MKNFTKMILAVVCGILLTTFVMLMLGFSILGALGSGKGTPVLPKSGVLSIDMSKISLAEQTSEKDVLASLSGNAAGTPIGILDAVNALNAAAEDPAVKYIFLKTDGLSSGLATLQEFRTAISHFRSSGKPVISYIESPSTGSYYLASVADKVFMTSHPGATTTVNGVSSQMIFLGDLLKKLGVNVQLIRHGKYKSAGEMFTRNSSSAENREQNQRMIDSVWESYAGEIAASRGISVDALNDAIDNLRLCLPEDFVEYGLVDSLYDKEGLEQKIADIAVADSYKDVSFIKFADYVTVKNAAVSKAKNKIAVIYADGEIVDGKEKAQVAGDRFASVIAKVCADSTVKAVVLRVNSPGGSVLASDKIKNEVDKLKEVKPVIASYGDYAASGGYWISNNCDKIFADAVTITGSIGVFGMVPDLSGTLKDVAKVNIEAVSSNKHGDMYGLMRPFDAAEYNYMLRSIEDIYDRFTSIVSEGRGIPKETVDEIGQGRVWTGSDALSINLVDEIGTLEDAVKYAAVAAGDPDLANWKVKGYPQPQTQMDMLMSLMDESAGEDALATVARQLKSSLGNGKPGTSPVIYARMDRQVLIY